MQCSLAPENAIGSRVVTEIWLTLRIHPCMHLGFCSLYAVARTSVVCLSVTFVHPTQAVVILSNFSTAFGTLAIH